MDLSNEQLSEAIHETLILLEHCRSSEHLNTSESALLSAHLRGLLDEQSRRARRAA